MSTCVKGQYPLNVQPAVNANNNIVTPNFATLNISAPGSLVADLDNSFISLEAQVTVNRSHPQLVNTVNGKDYDYFLGFKSSFEAIRQYEILVNGNTVYTQFSLQLKVSFKTKLRLNLFAILLSSCILHGRMFVNFIQMYVEHTYVLTL
jgi:hypothetical protein